MIFKQWQQVLDGTKTQTRRLVNPGERCRDGITVSKYWISRFTFMPPAGADLLHWTFRNPKWQIGRDYAVQPGRGKKAIGRIRLLEIRSEPLWDIDGPDCLDEGLSAYDNQGMHKTVLDLFDEYAQLWDSIYGKLPDRSWDGNPDVWVLTFEIVT